MKKLFLLLAFATATLFSCSEPSRDYHAIDLHRDSDKDSIVVIDKCIIESCTKIVADTFNYVDCNGVTTKQYDLDTIKTPTLNYIFYKRIGNTKIEKEAVSKIAFDNTRKGDTTSLYELWYSSLPKVPRLE